MAYTVTKSNGTDTFAVSDGSVNSTPGLSIGLVGRNTVNYGQEIASTQLHMLENFATIDTSPPISPVIGQLWFDRTAQTIQVRVGLDDTVGSWSALLASGKGGDIGGPSAPNDDGKDNVYTKNVFVDNIYPYSGTTVTIHNDWVLAAGATLQATYADLAERFESDAIYVPGTIVAIGGDKEITQTTSANDQDVLGVVSTDPAFLLNAKAGFNETHPPVALAGRIPTRIIGPVTKGQRIVTSDTDGVARAGPPADLDTTSTHAIIGRALESSDDAGEKMIMVIVGTK